MNQPPGYPPGGPPFPGQPGAPPPQATPPAAAPPRRPALAGTQIMNNAPLSPALQAQLAAAKAGMPPPAAPGGMPGMPPPAAPGGVPGPGAFRGGVMGTALISPGSPLAAGFGPPPGAPNAPGAPQGAPPYAAPQQQPYAPPPLPAYTPPTDVSQFGQPAPGFAPPAPYGAPPTGGYGAPGYGAPAYGGGSGEVGLTGAGVGVAPGGPRPTMRNAVMTMLLPIVLGFGGMIVGGVAFFAGALTNTEIIALAGEAVAAPLVIAAAIISLVSTLRMLGELRALTNSTALGWWCMFVPLYNLYFAIFVVPTEMGRAKAAVRAEPARSIIFYWLFFSYAFAADLNDVARAMPG